MKFPGKHLLFQSHSFYQAGSFTSGFFWGHLDWTFRSFKYKPARECSPLKKSTMQLTEADKLKNSTGEITVPL